MPQVNVPVTVDTGEIATVVRALAEQTNMALAALAQAFGELDSRLSALAEGQEKLLKAIAAIKPTVNMPARPKGFSVQVLEDVDGVKTMRVEADTTH